MLELNLMKRKTGFTIVEILIVIALAMFILTIGQVALRSFRLKQEVSERALDVSLFLREAQANVIAAKVPPTCPPGSFQGWQVVFYEDRLQMLPVCNGEPVDDPNFRKELFLDSLRLYSEVGTSLDPLTFFALLDGTDYSRKILLASPKLSNFGVIIKVGRGGAIEVEKRTNLAGWQPVVIPTATPGPTPTPLPPKPGCDEKTTAFWHLDEQSGDGAYLLDSCNNNHATPRGAVYAQGKINGGRRFDGQDDDIVANNEANFDFKKDEPITIEAWIYPTDLYNNKGEIINNRDQIVTKGHDEGNRNFEFSVAGLNNGTGRLFFGYKPHISWDDLGNFIFDYYKSTSYQIYSSINPIIRNNNWYHVAIVYKYRDPNSAKFYVNGAEVAGSWTSGNGKISPEPENNYPVMLGAEVNSAVNERFDGIIDEVKISKTLRSVAEIQSSYNR